MTEPTHRPLGFWACWALVVGTMIGSGIFLLPTQLAHYGLLGFGGLLVAALGAMSLALVFSRLAGRTRESGGPYVYVREAFGDFTGFINAWALWVSYWIAIPIVAIAFVGYLVVFLPALSNNPAGQAIAGLGVTWVLTLISARGLREASFVQIMMTLLKIVPLVLIISVAFFAGHPSNLPAPNPTHAAILPTVAAVALLALWPFTGFEVGVMPAGNVRNPERVIPRAVVIGVATVAAFYLAATVAVMLIVPADTLAASTAPFAEAARALGAWGPMLIALGALIAMIGTLNGVLFCCGQLPMAAALDKLAPSILAKRNRGDSPYVSLLLSTVLGSILLLANYTRGLVSAYNYLVTMSTMIALAPYLFCALAELRHSWRTARAWAAVALLASTYSLFAVFGSGWEALWQGALLIAAGAPVYLAYKYLRPRPAAAVNPTS